MSWYLLVLKKYAVFSGRARRKEIWYFILFDFIFAFALGLFDSLIGIYVLSSLNSLAVLLPSLGVAITRLHDTGRTGWWIFIGLIPLIGAIILLVFFITDSQPETNQYGPSPKAV